MSSVYPAMHSPDKTLHPHVSNLPQSRRTALSPGDDRPSLSHLVQVRPSAHFALATQSASIFLHLLIVFVSALLLSVALGLIIPLSSSQSRLHLAEVLSWYSSRFGGIPSSHHQSQVALQLAALYLYTTAWVVTIGTCTTLLYGIVTANLRVTMLAAVALWRPEILPLARIAQGLLTQRRYRRHHVFHLRLDRLRRLVYHPTATVYTIFICPFSGPTIPLGTVPVFCRD